MRWNIRLCSLVLATLFLLPFSEAFAMRCGNQLVSLGDTKIEVEIKCGPPAFSNLVALETSRKQSPNGSVTEEVPVEQWIYNQGPDTLMKTLTFKGGRLTDIDEGARVGVPEDKPAFTAGIGDSQAEILLRYGEPLSKEVVGTENEKYRPAPDTTIERAVPVELWIYDFGPGTFLKLLTFKAGRLVKIEDGVRR